jgi:hypothetical protein
MALPNDGWNKNDGFPLSKEVLPVQLLSNWDLSFYSAFRLGLKQRLFLGLDPAGLQTSPTSSALLVLGLCTLVGTKPLALWVSNLLTYPEDLGICQHP